MKQKFGSLVSQPERNNHRKSPTSSIDVHAQTSSRRIFHEQKRCPGGSSNEAIGTLPLSLTS